MSGHFGQVGGPIQEGQNVPDNQWESTGYYGSDGGQVYPAGDQTYVPLYCRRNELVSILQKP